MQIVVALVCSIPHWQTRGLWGEAAEEGWMVELTLQYGWGDEIEGWVGSAGVSCTAAWAGMCGGRCKGGWVVRVSLWEARGCQRLVEHLGMEQKTVAFQHCPY